MCHTWKQSLVVVNQAAPFFCTEKEKTDGQIMPVRDFMDHYMWWAATEYKNNHKGHWFHLSMLCKLTIYIGVGLAHHSFLNCQFKTLKMRKSHLLSRPVLGRWPGFLAWFLDIFHPQPIFVLKLLILVISICLSLISLESILWRSNLYSRTFNPLGWNFICEVILVHQSKDTTSGPKFHSSLPSPQRQLFLSPCRLLNTWYKERVIESSISPESLILHTTLRRTT